MRSLPPLAAIAVSIGAFAVGLGAPAPAAAAGQMMHVVEHATTNLTAHIGPKPDNSGDVLTFSNPIFNATNESRIGSDQGFCVRLIPGKSYECIWTLLLANGQITVEGPFYDAGDTDLAITGGTGAYATARGEMHLHARDAKGSAYDFLYKID